MSRSRSVLIEYKCTAGEAAQWTTTVTGPGFQPDAYRVVGVTYGPAEMAAVLPVAVHHDQLGFLCLINPAYPIGTGQGGTAIVPEESRLHNSTSTFTLIRNGAPATDLSGRIMILLECAMEIAVED